MLYRSTIDIQKQRVVSPKALRYLTAALALIKDDDVLTDPRLFWPKEIPAE